MFLEKKKKIPIQANLLESFCISLGMVWDLPFMVNKLST